MLTSAWGQMDMTQIHRVVVGILGGCCLTDVEWCYSQEASCSFLLSFPRCHCDESVVESDIRVQGLPKYPAGTQETNNRVRLFRNFHVWHSPSNSRVWTTQLCTAAIEATRYPTWTTRPPGLLLSLKVAMVPSPGKNALGQFRC
jgi:hypothetical protein